MVRIKRGARTARRTIGTAIAMVNVPAERPGPGVLVVNGVLVERAAATNEDEEELVAVAWLTDCFTDADLKGVVSVTIFGTVVHFVVIVGRLVTRGIAEGCAGPLAASALCTAATGVKSECGTARASSAIVEPTLWLTWSKTDHTAQWYYVSHTSETLNWGRREVYMVYH